MKEMLKKEYLYGLRNSKFIIIGIVYVFFAISVPVMVKVLLPAVLRGQFPGMSEADLAMMIDISQFGALTNYLKNIFEVGFMVVSFSLSGLIASEIKDNTLVLPICSGRKFAPILLSKFIVNAGLLILATFVGLTVTYYYSGIMFDNEIAYSSIMRSALLESVLAVFVVSLVLFYGTFIKKPITTGLLIVGTIYLSSFAGGLFEISEYLPTGLHIAANTFTSKLVQDNFVSIGITILLTGLLLVITLEKLKRIEWNQR